MRWGNNQGPFIRPIKWILSLWDTTVIPITLFNITSSNHTYGHRFLSNDKNKTWTGKQITITSADSYQTQLKKEGLVVLDPNERSKIIEDQIPESQREQNKHLLEELVYITENPNVIHETLEDEFKNLELRLDILKTLRDILGIIFGI